MPCELMPKQPDWLRDNVTNVSCEALRKPVSTLVKIRNHQIMDSSEPLSLLFRLYIYSIHGYVCEVLFTAFFDFAVSRDWRFRGVSSLWALFIYGVAMLGVEHMYLTLRFHCSFLLRALLYTIWVYICEFTSGWILRRARACPWDYSHYRYNYKGLVTLEYAPFWLIGCVLLEKFLISYTLRLRLD
ncbi:transmembrane protein 229B-like [Hyperolius riggenbachi]|uniref:transmembrane protein 229B-like n=1 Tax=Hyperolius riggenbachi TaxID=752182 RepID=UPI0035A37F94